MQLTHGFFGVFPTTCKAPKLCNFNLDKLPACSSHLVRHGDNGTVRVCETLHAVTARFARQRLTKPQESSRNFWEASGKPLGSLWETRGRMGMGRCRVAVDAIACVDVDPAPRPEPATQMPDAPHKELSLLKAQCSTSASAIPPRASALTQSKWLVAYVLSVRTRETRMRDAYACWTMDNSS